MVSTKNYWYPHCGEYTTQKLIPPPSSSSQEDSGDEYNYAAINNTYDTNTEYLTSESQSNESLFNINFDAIDDEVLELDAISLFEESLSASTNDLLLENKVESAEVKVGHAQSIQVATTSSNSVAKDIDINRAKMKEIHICTSEDETVSAAAAIQLPEIKPQRAITVACSSPIHLDGVEKMTLNKITTETTTTTTIRTATTTTTSRILVKANDNNKKVFSNQIECVPEKPKKLRCAECNKKLGVIMVMKCHCGKLFCAQHRYAEAHSCTYDYKSEGQKVIARENPVVVAQKLQKF